LNGQKYELSIDRGDVLSNCIVTGGAGFIGSHVVEKLLQRGHNVFVIDNLSGGYIENIPHGANFFNASCEDYNQMRMVFEKTDPEYVFHIAAFASEGLSPHVRRFNYVNNIISSVNLINLSVIHKIRHFIFTSSMACFGSQQPPFTEDMPYAPVDPYGIAKQAIEQDIICAHNMFGLDYTIYRPHNIIGQRQNIWDSVRNVCGIFIHQVLHDKPLTIFGDGTQVRAFSHSEDIANPIVDSISGEYPEFMNEIFNIGGDVPITILELANIIKDIAKKDGKNITFIHEPPRIEVHSAYSDHTKLRKFYKYQSGKTIYDMACDLYMWAKTQPDRPLLVWARKDIELMEKLPLKWENLLK
jgi:UDP-glucose 4-epimerase